MAKPADLLSVTDAQARILQHFRRLDAEPVALEAALHRVLASAVRSGMDLPPFANSSMDGFAVRSEDTGTALPTSPVSLTVIEQIAAGSTGSRTVGGGECARIMTGAPLPPGADAVVPFEDVEDSDGGIRLSAPVAPRACVRPAGQDVHSGQALLGAGTEVGAPQLALLAAIGMDPVEVVRQPTVAILATGDELVAPGRPLGPGQIYNSNTPMLAAAVREAGGIPRIIPASGDDRDALARAIDAAEGCDLLLTSGGASVGDFDYVKDVVGASGSVDFWRVRVRPGKPLLFGSVGAQQVIGLPGNPTSAMVTFELFARPAIRTMGGAPPYRTTLEAVLDEDVENRGGRETYARVRLRYSEGRFHAALSGGQDSAMLVPLAAADGLLRVPADRAAMEAGETATVQVWRLPVP